MGSLSGILQRPIVAAAAVGLASFSTDLPDKVLPPKSSGPHSSAEQSITSHCNSGSEQRPSWVSRPSLSQRSIMSFVTRIRVPVPNIDFSIPNLSGNTIPSTGYSSVVASPVLLNLYQSAELAKTPKQVPFTYVVPSSLSEVSYRWHPPEPKAYNVSGNSECSLAKSRTVVVLLGWLGAKQKHLRRYAEWYTSRGFQVITFTIPMTEILSYQAGGKAEQNVELLVRHLADWLEEEDGKNLVFHTFSNTGWLTYGAILEKFQEQDISLMAKIRGCVVDSAPVANPDPQVWASGFSAAFLKKRSIATQGFLSDESGREVLEGKQPTDPKPAVAETALQLLLENFFKVVLNLPTVNRRLSDVLCVLASKQPACPQLYIYSSADRVIPAGSVESFIEAQRRAGREVRACNFVSTPHVDHYRNDPKLYTSQLTQFFEDCVLTGCKGSS